VRSEHLLLAIFILTAISCSDDDEPVNVGVILTSKAWIAEKYKLPHQETTESYALKKVYDFYENGTYKIRRPYHKQVPLEIDTVEVFGQWTYNNLNSVIRLSGTDTWILEYDTLTLERNDWKILSIDHTMLKVENILPDGQATEHIEILSAQ
jgi:hypothetical protein